MRSAAAAVGLVMMGLAAFLAPGLVKAPVVVGVLAVLLSLRPRPRWPAAVTAACLAAIMTAAADRGDLPALAEGLLVVGYLLLLDAIERPRTGLWPAAVAAALGSGGVVFLALMLPTLPRPYLVLAGLGAIAAGYAVAVPRGRRRAGGRR